MTENDLIVSNPPYVSSKEYESLPIEYFHEPKAGLVWWESGLYPGKNSQEARIICRKGFVGIELGHSNKFREKVSLVPFFGLVFAMVTVLSYNSGTINEYCNELN